MNELVDIANEYRRLQRQLEQKTARLEALRAVNGEAGQFPTDFEGALNRRYSIEFLFQPPPANPTDAETIASLQAQERQVVIEQGTVFRCAYVESFLRAVGTALDPFSGLSTTVQATLPWNDRRRYFDYLWTVRDTGTDRDWVAPPQPSWFGGGGYTGPLWLPRRTILSGGTSLYARVEPFRSQNADEGGFFSGGTISQYILQMSFVGHQVPDNESL